MLTHLQGLLTLLLFLLFVHGKVKLNYFFKKLIHMMFFTNFHFYTGCDNGQCDVNGECICHEGYKLEPAGRKFCVPQCRADCTNGVCTAPDTCSCNAGYRQSDSGRCEPICSGGCSLGECVAPEKCSCREGYWVDGPTCRPICAR